MIIDTINYVGPSIFIEDALRELPFEPQSFSFNFNKRDLVLPVEPIIHDPLKIDAYNSAKEIYEAACQTENVRPYIKGFLQTSGVEGKLSFNLSEVVDVRNGEREFVQSQTLTDILGAKNFAHLEIFGEKGKPAFKSVWPYTPSEMRKLGYTLVSGKVIFGEHRHIGEDDPVVAGQLYFQSIPGTTDFNASLNFTGMLSRDILSTYGTRFKDLAKQYKAHSTLS
jgi:hypothetical protein